MHELWRQGSATISTTFSWWMLAACVTAYGLGGSVLGRGCSQHLG